MRFTTSKVALLLVPMLLLSSAAGAVTLWDQSVIAPAGPGIANSNSPGFGGFVAHSVNDITVPAGGWHVTSITQYYSFFNASWTGITQGFINVQPKTGPLPTSNPAAVQSPMSAAIDPVQSALLGQSVLAVTAIVNLNLLAGDYWIGITPSASAGISGANQQWPAAKVGSAVVTWFSPGPWGIQPSYANWDGAFILKGDDTVGVEGATMTVIKSLYR